MCEGSSAFLTFSLVSYHQCLLIFTFLIALFDYPPKEGRNDPPADDGDGDPLQELGEDDPSEHPPLVTPKADITLTEKI